MSARNFNFLDQVRDAIIATHTECEAVKALGSSFQCIGVQIPLRNWEKRGAHTTFINPYSPKYLQSLQQTKMLIEDLPDSDLKEKALERVNKNIQTFSSAKPDGYEYCKNDHSNGKVRLINGVCHYCEQKN